MIRFVLLMFFPLVSFGQLKIELPAYSRTVGFENKKFSYTIIDTVQGVKKAELFLKIQGWMSENYLDIEDVIMVKELDLIIFKKIFNSSFDCTLQHINTSVERVVRMEVKDGMYKIIVNNFRTKGIKLIQNNSQFYDYPLEDYIEKTECKSHYKTLIVEAHDYTQLDFSNIKEYVRTNKVMNIGKW